MKQSVDFKKGVIHGIKQVIELDKETCKKLSKHDDSISSKVVFDFLSTIRRETLLETIEELQNDIYENN